MEKPELTPLAREFLAMKDALGWSNTETAKRLYKTQPHISQIVNGVTQPSIALVQMMKMILTAERPDLAVRMRLDAVPQALNDRPLDWTDEVIGALRARSPKVRPQALKSVLALIESFPANEVEVTYSQKDA